MLKTKTWIILFATILVISGITSFFILSDEKDCTVVQIIQDGFCINEFDLSKVTSTYELKIKDKNGGYNIIQIEPGKIRVKCSDCPDQVCVHQGWLKTAAPIVCLPHKLVIQYANTNDIDSVSK